MSKSIRGGGKIMKKLYKVKLNYETKDDFSGWPWGETEYFVYAAGMVEAITMAEKQIREELSDYGHSFDETFRIEAERTSTRTVGIKQGGE